MPRLALAAEFAVLFAALPLAVRFAPVRLPLLPLLWIATLYCWLVLRADPAFPRAWLWNPGAVPRHPFGVLALFAVFSVLLVLAVRRFAPELLFTLVRTRPALWAAIMVVYPILSVYPQGIVYRAFLMHRYAGLFPNPILIIAVSALAFSFMHLVFRNPVAPALTLLGGILFAWRFQTTHSLALSSLEHALYGCALFTAGLGRFFFGGSLPPPHR